jgi:hypothetical protein
MGKPDKSGVMSEPLTASVVVPVSLVGLLSLPAPVEPFSVLVPVLTGVPETVQVILAPAATVAGGVGEQLVLRPAGRPLIAHEAFVADAVAVAELVQVKVPL